MITFPKAKVNIGLQITEKRPDGFHNLETLFFPADICDILEVVEAPSDSFNLHGIKLDGNPHDNLCIKAYNLLKREFNLPPVEIHLYKKIPAGAGLGGGSSDAANTLILLNKLFALNLSAEVLAEYALQLGSDCPYFIYAKELDANVPQALYGTGRGDLLTKIDVPSLKGYKIKIKVPNVFVSTAVAYSNVTPQKPVVELKKLLELPIEEWRENIINDFEKSVFKMFPLIEEYKLQMYREGAVYASMSGSGSAVFGIFKS
jgi:4-diphosphocytidyl-2-C-methyl-D-erythritol kinase